MKTTDHSIQQNNSLLSKLEEEIQKGAQANFAQFSNEAKTKFQDGTTELTEEAIQEAKNYRFDPARYKTILTLLKNTQVNSLSQSIIKQYNTGKIDLEKLFSESSVASLVSLYPFYKAEMDITKLLLVNQDTSSNRTTFAHELFARNASKADIIDFFKKLNILASLNPELLSNYLNLSDIKGKSIHQVVTEQSLTNRYLGIETTIKNSCTHLYPRNGQDLETSTHTASVHGSVDQSLVRLACNYDSELVQQSSARNVNVNRDNRWNYNIQKDLDQLKSELEAIISTDQAIDQFIKTTLVKGENVNEAREKFKFQAQTTLRLIEGLNQGHYGNHYTVAANEEVSCGLTPKEIVAIGYASLKDRHLWKNHEKETQQFMQFVENLYIAKRGYNIDLNGPREWEQPFQEDDNKCTGGTVNQIVYGLTDHKLVEVKVITPDTMKPILINKLKTSVLAELSEHPDLFRLTQDWLAGSLLNSNLSTQIIAHLQQDAEFSQEFSEGEIRTIGMQVLNQLNKTELAAIKQELQKTLSEQFSQNAKATGGLSDRERIYSFEIQENKGYVPYLESLFAQDQERFKSALQAQLRATINEQSLDGNDARKMNVILNLLLASSNQEIVEATKELFVEHCNSFQQRHKDQYLILAAERGYLPLLLALVDSGADIRATDSRWGHDHNTALHYFAQNNHVEAIKKLVNLGADISTQDQNGNTALHIAAEKGHIEAIEKLVELGANINAQAKNGNAALHCAAQKGQIEAIEKLVELGAYINAQNKNGRTALHIAACYGKTEAIEKLVKLRANINAQAMFGQTALHDAAKQGHIEAIEKLVHLGANINAQAQDGKTALHDAAYYDQTEAIEKLVKLGADIQVQDKYGTRLIDTLHIRLGKLLAADSSKTVDIITNLVKRASGYIQDDKDIWKLIEAICKNIPGQERLNVIINALEKIDNTWRRYKLLSFIPEHETFLHNAAEQGNIEAIEKLVNLGADISAQDKDGRTALHIAASKDNIKAIEKLVELKADINAQGKYGKTALHIAAEQGHIEAIGKLVELKADINAQAKNGRTALHIAAEQGHIEAIEKLVSLGADINAQDKYGETALHIAAYYGKTEAIEKLVELGAYINAQDKDGKTALHIAAYYDKTEAIEKLVELGANINAQAKNGNAALHCAAQEGQIEAMATLVCLNAHLNISDKKGVKPMDKLAQHKLMEHVKLLATDSSKTAGIITNLVKQSSGYIQDDKNIWKLIEAICKNIPDQERLNVIINALEKIDNTWRRDKLLSFIPEHERNVARNGVSLTLLEKIRELGEVVHGNSSIEVPERALLKELSPLGFSKSDKQTHH